LPNEPSFPTRRSSDLASYNNQLEVVRILLEAGADVNLQDSGGNTALMGVCFKGYPKVAELLTSHGADLNLQHSNGGTALMFAVLDRKSTRLNSSHVKI